MLVAALIERGATDEAREALDGREAPAALHLAEGDFERAIAAARDAGWRRTAKGQTNPARSGWRSTLALALAHAGQVEEAAAVADDEVALARAFGAPTPLARALHARCVAEPDLEPRAELAAAVLATPTPATLLHASARIELGIAQLRLGHPAEARAALTTAAAVAAAAGALPLAERARRALAAAGPGEPHARSWRPCRDSPHRGARRSGAAAPGARHAARRARPLSRAALARATSRPRRRRQRGMSRRTFAIATACAGGFLAFLDTTIVNTAFPEHRRVVPGRDAARTSRGCSTPTSSSSPRCSCPAGGIADRIGRKRVFLAGVVLFVAASAACAAAPRLGGRWSPPARCRAPARR